MKAHPPRDLRIGLVGAGRWGMNYLRVVPETPTARLVAVCDVDPAARARASRSGVLVTAEMDELLPLVDAVVIAAPSALHAHLSVRAFDAGKHVLVEKPLATDVVAAADVIARAAVAERILLVGHLTLFQPALIELQALLKSGAIGELKAIDVTRTSMGARHRRESALWSLGPHDIANVLFVSGCASARVRDAWAKGDDEAGLELELEGGAQARMTWSRCSAITCRRTLIHGSEASIVLDEMTGELRLERRGGLIELSGGGGGPSLLHRQCAAFVRAILDLETVPLHIALQVVRLLASAQARLDRQLPEQKLSAAI